MSDLAKRSMVDTEKLLSALRNVRLTYPHLRCGQIVTNVLVYARPMDSPAARCDAYFIEDGDLANAIRAWAEHIAKDWRGP